MGHIKIAAGVIVIIFTFLAITLLLLLSYQSIELLIQRRAAEFLQHPTFPEIPPINIPNIPNLIYQQLIGLRILIEAERAPILPRENDYDYGTDANEIDLEKGPEELDLEPMDEKVAFNHDRSGGSSR